MIDWRQHYDDIYASQGVAAVLTLEETTDAVAYDLTVIDKTAGVEVGDAVTVSSIKPVAAVRMREITDHGLSRDVLNGARIAFNGATWTITSHRPKPSPIGEAAGELYLILSE